MPASAFTFKFDEDTVYVPENFQEYHRTFYALGRFYEEDLLRHIRQLERAGTYVDVGGGVGNHSVFFARFCKARRVHTFEPNKKLHPYVDALASANGVRDRIKLHPFGLSGAEKMGEATFILREQGDNITATVPLRRMDDVIAEDDVAVIKIDVEGAEPRVLRGATNVMERCRPVLFVEALSDRKRDKIMSIVGPLGYAMTGRVFRPSPCYEIAFAG